MKRITIFTMLLLFAFTLASTSETFALEIFEPEIEDDPYTTTSDDIVFEGGGGGTIDRSPTQPDEISDYDWPVNVDAIDFDYKDYDMSKATIYNNNLVIPTTTEGSSVEVDQCSELSGNWLRTGETYQKESRYVGNSTYYRSIGETGDFSVGDYYYYQILDESHSVYEKYDICQKYDVIELSTSLNETGKYLHWNYLIDYTSSSFNGYYTYMDVYILDAVMIMDAIESFMADYENLNSTELLLIIDEWLSDLGNVLTWVGLIGGVVGVVDKRIAIAAMIVGQIGEFANAQAMKDYMLENNANDINDIVSEIKSDGLSQYIMIKIGKRYDPLDDSWEGKAILQETNNDTMSLYNGVPNHQFYGNISIEDNDSTTYSEIWEDFIDASEIETIENELN